MSIGELLQSCRENKRLTVEEVSAAIRINKKFIRALEDENFLLIPSQVYAKGFLKAYSDYLGLDTRSLLDDLMKYYNGREEHKKPKVSQVKTKNQVLGGWSLPQIYTAIFIILILFFLYEYWSNARMSQPAGTEKIAATVESSSKVVRKGTVEAMPRIVNKGTVDIKIAILTKSWVSVLVSGKEVFSGTLEAGSVKSYSGKAITVKTDNGAGVRISRDGKLLGPLGGPASAAEQSYRAAP